MAALESFRNAPNTQREYETIFILTPDTAQDAVATINQRVRGIVEQMGGKLLKVDNWGKRKLAYEVRKELKGIYLYWRYLASVGLVEEVERNLKMLEPVIRFYTVKIDEDVIPDARPSEVTDESFANAATTGPDEEELMTGAASRADDDDEDDDDEDDDDDEIAAALPDDGDDVVPGSDRSAASKDEE
jgi:small subunit ribosomal protein S6